MHKLLKHIVIKKTKKPPACGKCVGLQQRIYISGLHFALRFFRWLKSFDFCTVRIGAQVGGLTIESGSHCRNVRTLFTRPSPPALKIGD